MQRAAGLFGSLIVSLPQGKTEPFSYDGGDLSVLLTDWYHKSIYQQELGLSSIPFQFVGEPQVGSLLACLDSLLPSSDHYPFSDSRETLSSLFPELLLLFWIGVVSLLLLLLVSSDLCWFLFRGCCMDVPPAASIQSLLIQGRGKYNCSLDLPPGGSAASSSPDCLQCNATNPACAPFVLPVQPGKTYRLRIGSMATLSSLNFKIEVNPFSILCNCALPGLTEAFSD